MSVLSPKRVLSVVATAFLAVSAFAVNPSPRDHARMVFDPQAGEIVLFGGTSAFDTGTQTAYESTETWVWTGTRWTQRFPANTPPARSAQAMTYDSMRGRVVMFGGRYQTGTGDERRLNLLSDTWIFDNGNWTEITPDQSPTPRHLAAMAYDPIRDRIVLYGGTQVGSDGLTSELKYDTWEYDGTRWNQVNNEQVKVGNPMMAYDAARDQMILLGSDTSFKPHMYRYDTSAKTWAEITPEKMPACANDGVLVYQSHSRTLLYTGGICATTDSSTDKTYEWNGTNWAEITTVPIVRVTGAAVGYDALRETTNMYGGTQFGDVSPRSVTMLYTSHQWRFATLQTRPSPRSLFAFTTDPIANTVWLYGGLGEYSLSYAGDLWGYRDGQWFVKTAKNPPASCTGALSAFDTARNRLVMACMPDGGTDLDVYEFDGNEFKSFDLDEQPDARRFAALAYDETLKKVVLFGGYDGRDFRDDTWTWDGTKWTEIKRDKPPNRSLHAMWYDPHQKRVILYGGIGRESIDDHVERFSDMWAFTGNGWTELKVTNTPGARLGSLYAVEPASGKLLLFGGMVHVFEDPEDDESGRQFYDNETWLWDGSANSWTKLSPARAPAPRQNGRIAYDPSVGRLVLFGGYAGFYYSDLWTWTGTNWEVRAEHGSRRRVVSPPAGGQPPTGID